MACNYATRKSAWSSCGIDRNIKAAKVYTCNVLSRPDDNILFALSHYDYANSGSTVSDKRGGLVVTLTILFKKIHIPFVSIVSPHEESEEPFVLMIVTNFNLSLPLLSSIAKNPLIASYKKKYVGRKYK